jgi:hypothetical protein
VSLVNDLFNLQGIKFSFGKSNEYHMIFSRDIGAASMYDNNFGLSIPTQLSAENQIRAVFRTIARENGYFIFNINGVDLGHAITGFQSFEEAEDNNMITEWELSTILQNANYLRQTIFHNGRTKLPQTNGGIEIRWN